MGEIKADLLGALLCGPEELGFLAFFEELQMLWCALREQESFRSRDLEGAHGVLVPIRGGDKPQGDPGTGDDVYVVALYHSRMKYPRVPVIQPRLPPRVPVDVQRDPVPAGEVPDHTYAVVERGTHKTHIVPELGRHTLHRHRMEYAGIETTGEELHPRRAVLTKLNQIYLLLDEVEIV